MDVSIEIAGPEQLAAYSQIPIAFEVTSVLSVGLMNGGAGGIAFREEAVEPSYVKDYDASEEGGPDRWGERFDLQNFVVFLGTKDGVPIGGATLVHNAPGLHMLAGRKDIVVLWDIRVAPGHRHDGIGTALFRQVVTWARSKGFKSIKIETQNINVPACRFYLKQGCELGEINRHAYWADPSVADEVMLVWYLDLPGR